MTAWSLYWCGTCYRVWRLEEFDPRSDVLGAAPLRWEVLPEAEWNQARRMGALWAEKCAVCRGEPGHEVAHAAALGDRASNT